MYLSWEGLTERNSDRNSENNPLTSASSTSSQRWPLSEIALWRKKIMGTPQRFVGVLFIFKLVVKTFWLIFISFGNVPLFCHLLSLSLGLPRTTTLITPQPYWKSGLLSCRNFTIMLSGDRWTSPRKSKYSVLMYRTFSQWWPGLILTLSRSCRSCVKQANLTQDTLVCALIWRKKRKDSVYLMSYWY